MTMKYLLPKPQFLANQERLLKFPGRCPKLRISPFVPKSFSGKGISYWINCFATPFTFVELRNQGKSGDSFPATSNKLNLPKTIAKYFYITLIRTRVEFQFKLLGVRRGLETEIERTRRFWRTFRLEFIEWLCLGFVRAGKLDWNSGRHTLIPVFLFLYSLVSKLYGIEAFLVGSVIYEIRVSRNNS